MIDIKSNLEKAGSHKEVGFLLVGVDVLGDPLRQKFDTQKAKNNPDRFFKKSVGVYYSIIWYLLIILVFDFTLKFNKSEQRP